jgi:hypothetical protein
VKEQVPEKPLHHSKKVENVSVKSINNITPVGDEFRKGSKSKKEQTGEEDENKIQKKPHKKATKTRHFYHHHRRHHHRFHHSENLITVPNPLGFYLHLLKLYVLLE